MRNCNHLKQHKYYYSYSFIRPFLYRPFKSSTTQRRSRLQHRYCIGVSRRSAQATEGKGLAQGPYVAVRAGVKPTTLRLKVIASTKAPPRPTVTTVTTRKSFKRWHNGEMVKVSAFHSICTVLLLHSFWSISL